MDDSHLEQLIREALDSEAATIAAASTVRQGRSLKATLVMASAASLLAVMAALAFRPAETPGLGSSASEQPATTVAAMPSLIGLTQTEAKAVLTPLNIELSIAQPGVEAADAAILEQSLPPGWPLTSTERVWVRVAVNDVTGEVRSLDTRTAKEALEAAGAELQRSVGAAGTAIRLDPFQDEKSPSCATEQCVAIDVNVSTQGAAVVVATKTSVQVVDVAWQTKPFSPRNLLTDDQLSSIAVEEPSVAGVLGARGYSLAVALGGDGGPYCVTAGFEVCATVTIFPVGNTEPILTWVNYVTGQAGLWAQAAPN